MTSAALGAKVSVATLDGMREVTIKPGFQSGNTIVLKDIGVTRLRGGGRGDLIVHVEVQIPTKLSKDQEELLKALAAARGEDGSTVAVHRVGESQNEGGLFSRFRDAFNR